MHSSDPRDRRTPRPLLHSAALATLAGLGVVAGVRLLTLPRSLWEWDEVLFTRAVEHFDPLHHSPHPPGYPLVVGLGKAVNASVGNPFASLVWLSVLSSLVAWPALVFAFRHLALDSLQAPAGAAGATAEDGQERQDLASNRAAEAAALRVAVTGALLFELSPAMLVHGPLALSDPPALMFLALALAGGGGMVGWPLWPADTPRKSVGWPAMASDTPRRSGTPPPGPRSAVVSPEADGGRGRLVGSSCLLGASAAAAIGCRPQLALSVLPMLAAALWVALPRNRRRSGGATLAAVTTIAAFTLVALLWFIPLTARVGGLEGLLAYLKGQAAYFAAHDAARVPAGQGAGLGAHGALLAQLAARFLADPWGPRWLAGPVLALAALGLAWLAAAPRRLLSHPSAPSAPSVPSDPSDHRRPAWLPLAVLAGMNLACCLLAMSPDDGVRYALPSLLGVAFGAACGLEALARRLRRPAWLGPGLAALLAASFCVYAAPLLAARTKTDSPPVQAARWAVASLPRRTIFLVDDDLAAHASYLLPSATLVPAEAGLARYAGQRGTPLFLLAEGESGWPGAVTFRWPASDAFSRLTRGHYRVVSLSPILPGRRYAADRGTHAFEPSLAQAGWRWLDQDAALRVFPLARSLALTLGLPREVPWAVNRVAIALDGAPPAVVEVPRGGRRTILLPLPRARSVEVAFRSMHSFVPNPADPRRLAVQLFGVEQLDR